MKTLVLQLPLELPHPQASYWVAELDTTHEQPTAQPQATPLALLPRQGQAAEVVLMVPAPALSWHRVTLPPGLARTPQRLQTALHSLLEERVLQEPCQLQWALAEQWQAGEPTWAAACDRAWLLAHLQALEQAGVLAQRIVPELAPPAQGQVWRLLGNEEHGRLWCASAQDGVSGWPLLSAKHLPQTWLADQTVLAEPALAHWAQTHLPTAAVLVDTASHWPLALQSGWNLAQFDLATRLRPGLGQRLLRWLDGPLRQASWRPARWGLLALLLVQVFGLQAWAWMKERQWQQQEAQWRAVLQQSFPHIQTVVDAPLQMAREVERVRQRSGQLGASDLEAQLQALGQALPQGVSGPKQLSFQQGRLHGSGWTLAEPQQRTLAQALQAQGYTLSMDGTRWQIEAPVQGQVKTQAREQTQTQTQAPPPTPVQTQPPLSKAQP